MHTKNNNKSSKNQVSYCSKFYMHFIVSFKRSTEKGCVLLIGIM